MYSSSLFGGFRNTSGILSGEPASDDAGSSGVEQTGRASSDVDLALQHGTPRFDSRLHVDSEEYSPGFTENVHNVEEEAVIDTNRTLDSSWKQLEPQPVTFFWEQGFWAEICKQQRESSGVSG